MKVAEEVRTIGEAFRDGLEAILGVNLVGVYLYGAVAFPEALPTGDIDFHVILEERLTDEERSALQALHESLAGQFPPLGAAMDGYYLLLKDARRETPPKSQMWDGATDHSWALHRKHIRAGRRIILYGPDPNEIYPPAQWPEIESALCSELDFVEQHLGEYPDYCILNLCRLMYSFETGDVVVSKAMAAEWAFNAFPAWRSLIDLARKSYPGQWTRQEGKLMLAEIDGLLEFAQGRIQACKQARQSYGEVDGRLHTADL
jgi:streptomycin 3"-adenylyltransferase